MTSKRCLDIGWMSKDGKQFELPTEIKDSPKRKDLLYFAQNENGPSEEGSEGMAQ